MRSLKVALATMISVGAVAAPAHAYFDARYQDKVRVTASQNVVKVYDTKCNGQAAQGNWIRAGSSTVYEKDNDAGCGSGLSFTAARWVLQIRACEVHALEPDPCGAWDSTG